VGFKVVFDTEREGPFDRSQELIDARSPSLGESQQVNMSWHVYEGDQSIMVAVHCLCDAVTEQPPADVIGQQREPPETREGQLVIVTGLVKMGDLFTMT
jgi:hypothetical protein